MLFDLLHELPRGRQLSNRRPISPTAVGQCREQLDQLCLVPQEVQPSLSL